MVKAIFLPRHLSPQYHFYSRIVCCVLCPISSKGLFIYTLTLNIDKLLAADGLFPHHVHVLRLYTVTSRTALSYQWDNIYWHIFIIIQLLANTLFLIQEGCNTIRYIPFGLLGYPTLFTLFHTHLPSSHNSSVLQLRNRTRGFENFSGTLSSQFSTDSSFCSYHSNTILPYRQCFEYFSCYVHYALRSCFPGLLDPTS